MLEHLERGSIVFLKEGIYEIPFTASARPIYNSELFEEIVVNYNDSKRPAILITHISKNNTQHYVKVLFGNSLVIIPIEAISTQFPAHM